MARQGLRSVGHDHYCLPPPSARETSSPRGLQRVVSANRLTQALIYASVGASPQVNDIEQVSAAIRFVPVITSMSVFLLT